MPTLKEFAGFRIVMYFEDHNPPHVHVVATDFEAWVAIRDAAIVCGAIPPRFRKRALEWIAKNREMLLAQWKEVH